MEQEARYYVCRDYQGGDFGTGRDYTIEQWRGQALEWAFSDDNYGLMKEIAELPKDKVLDDIAEIWTIQFRKCRKDKKHFESADDKFWTYEEYAKKYDLTESE